MARNGVKTGGGSRKGVPNKTTVEARQAIATFVNGNAGRLQDWLDKVADGVIVDGDYVVPPNPEKAFALFQSVIEYHVPKLGRTIVAGDPDLPVQHEVSCTIALDFEEVKKRIDTLK